MIPDDTRDDSTRSIRDREPTHEDGGGERSSLWSKAIRKLEGIKPVLDLATLFVAVVVAAMAWVQYEFMLSQETLPYRTALFERQMEAAQSLVDISASIQRELLSCTWRRDVERAKAIEATREGAYRIANSMITVIYGRRPLPKELTSDFLRVKYGSDLPAPKVEDVRSAATDHAFLAVADDYAQMFCDDVTVSRIKGRVMDLFTQTFSAEVWLDQQIVFSPLKAISFVSSRSDLSCLDATAARVLLFEFTGDIAKHLGGLSTPIPAALSSARGMGLWCPDEDEEVPN